MNAPESGGSRHVLRSRGRREAALVSQDRWLVSYADFMTLLFAFFVVLFATSRHSADGFGRLSGAIHSGFSGGSGIAKTGAPETRGFRALVPDQEQLTAQLRSVLGDSIERHEVSLQQTPDGLVISFQELGFFHSGEASLLPGQASKIEQAGAILKQHGLTLRVEGHSDDQPIHNATFSSNWELSAARAMTVLLLLVDQTHYDPTRISVAGYGAYRPVGDNGTPEGRQKNRRVDLVVVRERAGGAAGSAL